MEDLLKNIFNSAFGNLQNISEDLKKIEIEETSQDKIISLKINGLGQLIDLKISENFDEDNEILADLIITTFNKALEKLNQIKKEKAQQLQNNLSDFIKF